MNAGKTCYEARPTRRVEARQRKRRRAMDTVVRRESAQIIPFPARGQRRAGARLDSMGPRAEPAAPAYEAAIGSGWYHEAAIEEALRTQGTGRH